MEAPTAGGHNAPPRTKAGWNERGEPVYGERDEPDLEVFRALGRPFWMAGSYARPEMVAHALAQGAAGVQIGTAFAYCEESGLRADLKRQVVEESLRKRGRVFTDPVASPTGFPFKVVELSGTLADEEVYTARSRVCDLGYLRTAYVDGRGHVGWRCPAEPVDDYLAKGGSRDDTAGRKCLCNALMSDVGLGQVRRDGSVEPVLVTSGDDVAEVARFLPEGASGYRAGDVIRYLLSGIGNG